MDTDRHRLEAAKGQFLVYQAEDGELVVNFEYRPDPEKTGQDGAWRDKRNAEAVETILAVLKTTDGHR